MRGGQAVTSSSTLLASEIPSEIPSEIRNRYCTHVVVGMLMGGEELSGSSTNSGADMLRRR